MEIHFSTVIRTSPVNRGGEFLKLDWGKKEIINRHTIYPKNPEVDDPNPRGNTRGGRGIILFENEVLVASYHTIEVFNHKDELIRSISNNLFAGLHEIKPDENNDIWAASTAIDAAVKVDRKSGQVLDTFWPREDPFFAKVFNLKPLEIDKNVDNRTRFLTGRFQDKSHLHLNAVTPFNGHVYALFNRPGAIVNLSKSEIVVVDKFLKGAHNLEIFQDGTTLVNSTTGNRILFYDIHRGRKIKEIDMLKFNWPKQILTRNQSSFFHKAIKKLFKSQPVAKPLFWRGMAVDGDYIFVGTSPASILCLNYKTNKLADLYSFSDDRRVCVHGLAIDYHKL